jgi:hypothetical protein
MNPPISQNIPIDYSGWCFGFREFWMTFQKPLGISASNASELSMILKRGGGEKPPTSYELINELLASIWPMCFFAHVDYTFFLWVFQPVIGLKRSDGDSNRPGVDHSKDDRETNLPVVKIGGKIYRRSWRIWKNWLLRSFLIPIGSMVLVHMLTWLWYIDGIHVTIYSIHRSYGLYFISTTSSN